MVETSQEVLTQTLHSSVTYVLHFVWTIISPRIIRATAETDSKQPIILSQEVEPEGEHRFSGNKREQTDLLFFYTFL